MRRIFLAVPPTQPILKVLLGIQASLKKEVPFIRHETRCRWIAKEAIHLTLHFLGRVTEDKLGALVGKLGTLKDHPSFPQTLDHWIAFPGQSSARVGGIGGKRASPDFLSLIQRSAQILEGLGLEVEKRPHYPHLTLVRFRSPMNFTDFKFTLEEEIIFPVDRVVLFESHLDPLGARYERISEFPLACGI